MGPRSQDNEPIELFTLESARMMTRLEQRDARVTNADVRAAWVVCGLCWGCFYLFATLPLA